MARRKNRRNAADAGLNITSMMDMLTIILVFLLKSFSTDEIAVRPSTDLEIPVSSAAKAPKVAVNLVVSRREILVDGVPVVTLENTLDSRGLESVRIPAAAKMGLLVSDLFRVLDDKAQVARGADAHTDAEDRDFRGQVLLQCDRRVPFSLLREVMHTAGQAKFDEFRFVVIKGG